MTNFSASGFIGITVIDGVVYPYYPTVAIEKGAYLPVDILMGNNLPDAWPACAALPDMSRDIAVSYLSETLPLWGCPKDLVPQALDTYGLTNCSANSTAASCCEIVTEMFLDFMMVCNAQRIFNGMINNQYSNKFFWYRMDCNASCPESSLHGACQHTSEIQFVFNTLSNYQSHSDNSTCQWNAETQQFSAQIINKWVQFAYGTLATGIVDVCDVKCLLLSRPRMAAI
jgi:carboxylesterase type B